MRNLKKFLALVLAMMMTLSLMVTVNASSFEDDEEITPAYSEAINVLTGLNVLKGYGEGSPNEGKFLPKNPITRAEVAAMIYRIAHNDPTEAQAAIYKDYDRFPDVPSTKWFAGVVNYCENSQLIKGYTDGTFKPGNNITGYEVLAMALRMLGYGQNGEFEGSNWRIQTDRYGRLAGLTKQIKEGTLGQPATREMVAEILFQALDADLVDYNMLRNYFPAYELVADTTDNRTAYAAYLNAGGKLPVAEDLFYHNWGIVGKANNLGHDPFGRPTELWVKDDPDDTLAAGNLYVLSATDDGDGATPGDGKKTVITVAMTPVATYDNAVDECTLAKEINNDKGVLGSQIEEILNGKSETADQATTDGLTTGIIADANKLDATHTTTKYIGATGRTTEIYLVDENPADPSQNEYVFVYIDTLLGEVTETTDELKDGNGHTIREAKAKITLGNKISSDGSATTGTAKARVMELKNPGGKFTKGDLVLIQTPNGASTKIVTGVAPDRVAVKPDDVPDDATEFEDNDGTAGHLTETNDAVILTTAAKKVEGVTITATEGQQNEKLGIRTSDGKTYWASNSFLAAKNTNNPTVLSKWYKVDDPDKGITNSMIGKTYDLVLDHHGYIIGMKPVVTVKSSVGVITGFDTKKISAGKYVTEVEAFMTDNTTQTFDVVGLPDGVSVETAAFDKDTVYRYWNNAASADTAWIPTDATTSDGEGADGGYGMHIGVGSLVKFAQITMDDGRACWKIDDLAADGITDGTNETFDKFLVENGVTAASGAQGVAAGHDSAATGVTTTLKDNTSLLNDDSVVFVAEYEYRYNTNQGSNDGSNMNKTYKVYEGFKSMPTVTGKAGDNNVLYQQLQKNPEYVLVYAQDASKEYIIRKQATITVDDSYFVLSRGATFAEYSEYNVLKNGVPEVLTVANSNTAGTAGVNNAIETAMAAGELITVTGRNAKDQVTAVEKVSTLAGGTDSVAKANVANAATGKTTPIITGDADIEYDDASVLTVDATHFLTVADGCVIKLVNLEQGTARDISMAEAVYYATTEIPTGSAKSNMVFELNEFGYVCALYVID